MDILTSPLPTKIKLSDGIHEINYDYRTIIRVLMAMEDNNLSQEEKLMIMIANIYKDEISENVLIEACEKAAKFIDCGKESKKQTSEKARIFSFKKDASYIYSGINSTHHIDLEKEPDLHWWKFMALFMDMDNECMFGELTYYRKRKIDGKLTKEEKKQYEKIKDLVELDDVHVDSESRNDFLKKLHETQAKIQK